MRFWKKLWSRLCLQAYARVFRFSPDEEIQVRIAKTQEDLRSAYKLLYKAYLKQGLTDENAHKLRLNFFSFLPQNTVIIAEKNNEIVGTICLIRDNPYGLPSENIFPDTIENIRAKGRQIAEASCLAISSKFRRSKNSNAVSLLVCKYMIDYAKEFMNIETLVFSAHPKAEAFYSYLLCAKAFPEVRNHMGVNGAPAQFFSIELERALERVVIRWKNTNFSTLFKYYQRRSFFFPLKEIGVSTDPVMTPSLMESFLKETEVHSKFTLSQLKYLETAYKQYFPRKSFQFLYQIPKREYRMESRIPVKLQVGRYQVEGRFLDISATGALLELPKSVVLEVGDQLMLEVEGSDCWHKLAYTAVRLNINQATHYSFGLKLLGRLPQDLADLLLNTHLNRKPCP